jgi:hypothetical protein
MHRSGTSSVTRSINLLGIYLGGDEKMMPANANNSEGFWEHREINDLQSRLLVRLNRNWDTATPMPQQWLESQVVHPFKDELAKLIAANFNGHPVWAWKDPRTCLLLPLWREALEKSETKLSCVFVVRSPVDVASSLMRRDGISFNKALGIWFNHNLTALKDAAGLPIVFLNYDRLLENWDRELRRCAAALNLDWPKDEARHRASMNAFIKPSLRHNQSARDQLQPVPEPVRELYDILFAASTQAPAPDSRFNETIDRLAKDFHAYASLIPNDDDTPRRGLVMTWRRPEGSGFQSQRFDSKDAPPNFIHRLLGNKLCCSLCKRLAKICRWLLP